MAMLEGKSGIVTGAARGFGRAAAERLCLEGARVALVDIKAEVVRKAASELTAQRFEAVAIVAGVADVSDEVGTERMMSFINGAHLVVDGGATAKCY
jgi:NAD(P)-dependent dehydrogenase (short-subunit alcohol dehydrogenase family)